MLERLRFIHKSGRLFPVSHQSLIWADVCIRAYTDPFPWIVQIRCERDLETSCLGEERHFREP